MPGRARKPGQNAEQVGHVGDLPAWIVLAEATSDDSGSGSRDHWWPLLVSRKTISRCRGVVALHGRLVGPLVGLHGGLHAPTARLG